MDELNKVLFFLFGLIIFGILLNIVFETNVFFVCVSVPPIILLVFIFILYIGGILKRD